MAQPYYIGVHVTVGQPVPVFVRIEREENPGQQSVAADQELTDLVLDRFVPTFCRTVRL